MADHEAAPCRGPQEVSFITPDGAVATLLFYKFANKLELQFKNEFWTPTDRDDLKLTSGHTIRENRVENILRYVRHVLEKRELSMFTSHDLPPK